MTRHFFFELHKYNMNHYEYLKFNVRRDVLRNKNR